MAQVKFYSVEASQYDKQNPDAAGIYFVKGGELYRGSERFGLGRVTVSASTAGIDADRGDIVVTGSGAGWVFDGTNWQSIGGDIGTITSAWKADISAAVAGLVAGGTGSYITGITQDAETGAVTASAAAFPTLATGDADGQVKLGSTNATVNGWSALTSSVGDLKSRVSDIEGIVDAANSTVSASTGTFTNLTITDTATFSATTVSTTSLTVNGSTIEQIADARIAAIAAATQVGASNGITVSVTTQGGSVTAVTVDATAFGNVMSFKGVVTAFPSENNVSGDIVVIGANPTGTGLVQGQEYIYNGSSWELIGDQNTYAVNAFSSTASVYTGATTLPAAVSAAGAAIDTLTTRVSTLESAVTGGTAGDGSDGVNVSVTTAATTAAPTVTVTLSKTDLNATLGTTNVADKTVATSIGATGVDTALATEKAVRDAITAALAWYGADGNPL